MASLHPEAAKLLDFAKTFVGTPYIYGADAQEAPHAFDCSSFVQYVFSHSGIELPRSSILQAADPQGAQLDPSSDGFALMPGDVVFMRSDRGHYYDELFGGKQIYIGHVGIYMGDGDIIHAKKSKGGVIIQPLEELTQDPHYALVMVKRYF
jgi:cell wall-associated NlpC family hydrolase